MKREILLVAVLMGGGYGAWRYQHPATHQKFQTAQVERRDIIAKVVATGTVNAQETVEVGSQVSGTLVAVYVDYNSRVRAGQTIALIDPAPFQTQLKEAQANLTSAQAQADAAKASLDEAKIAVSVAQQQNESQQAAIKISESAKAVAQRIFDHDEALAAANAVTDDTVKTDQTNLAVADDDRLAAIAQAKSGELAIADKQAEVQQAEAQLDAANAAVQQNQASVATAKVNLEHTQILSPIDGRVLDRKVSGGETVQASAVAPVLFELIPDTKGMQVDVDVDESDVSQVKPGQNATFTVDSYPGVTFPCLVRQIREDATNIQNVISYDVVLDIIKPPVELFPGMTANVAIEVVARRDVLAIPNSALRYRPTQDLATGPVHGPHVYQLGVNGALVPESVVVGVTDGRFTELVSGKLNAGDAVVSASTTET